MVHFARMVLSSTCLVMISYELLLGISLSVLISVNIQGWAFCEWLATRKRYKLLEYDIILSDVIPFLAQAILFYKIIT